MNSFKKIKLLKIIIILFFFILFQTFKINTENNISYKKIISQINAINNSKYINILLEKDTIIYNTEIKGGDYSLIIKTSRINDTLYDIYQKGYSFSYFNSNQINYYVITNQILNFYFKDSLIKTTQHNVKKNIKKFKNGKQVRVLENEITNISFIHGQNGDLYYIEGYGGCNTCSEYFAFYSLSGDLLWDFYSIKDYSNNQWKNLIKNFYQITDDYQINTSKNREYFETTVVSPFEEWNTKYYMRIIIFER